MKILHTSDWHLGQDFYHYNRKDEYDYFFTQLEELIRTEQPDALLVAGDIYHTAAPSNESVRQFTDWLLRLSSACPKMQTVVVGGNHDSQSRLDSTSQLWQLARVSVCGSLQADEDTHIVRIPGVGYIASVPHFYPRKGEEESVFRRLGKKIAMENSEQLPVVCMGHLYVSGCAIDGHNPDNIGGMEAESTDIFGPDFDYVALGHIHCPQTLPGGRVRYAGSPLHVSMDENYPHSVTIVELGAHGQMPVIREHRINQLRHCYNIPKSGTLSYDELISELRAFDPEEEGYVMPRVCVDSFLPMRAETDIKDIFAAKPKLRFTDWNIEIRRKINRGGGAVFTASQMKDISEIEMASTIYKDRYDKPLPEAYKQLLNEVITELHQSNKGVF